MEEAAHLAEQLLNPRSMLNVDGLLVNLSFSLISPLFINHKISSLHTFPISRSFACDTCVYALHMRRFKSSWQN